MFNSSYFIGKFTNSQNYLLSQSESQMVTVKQSQHVVVK